jgi:hypothetical protein
MRRLSQVLWSVVAAVAFLGLTGCSTLPRADPAPASRSDVVPARIVGNLFLVETTQLDGRLRRFLVDTGSSISYISTDAAQTLAVREREERTVQVQSANGGSLTLPAVTLRRLLLGTRAFERVPAAVFDFSELSAHLGLTIDGLLAFPLFRDHLLTLDYPRARLIVAPQTTVEPARSPDPRVSTLAFNNEQRIPFIPLQMGNESFVVLIDSGSDGALSLNPTGLHPRFTFGPRTGTLVASLAGDREQQVGRLAQDVRLGTHTLATPIVDLTSHVSAIGGELLQHFTLTFDQQRNLVTFAREADGAVAMDARRSTGLALARSPIYWRVLSVLPDTPTSSLGVQPGELVVRINGERVDQWGYQRFAQLLQSTAKVTFTFLAGTREFDREIPVFDLVP